MLPICHWSNLGHDLSFLVAANFPFLLGMLEFPNFPNWVWVFKLISFSAWLPFTLCNLSAIGVDLQCWCAISQPWIMPLTNGLAYLGDLEINTGSWCQCSFLLVNYDSHHIPEFVKPSIHLRTPYIVSTTANLQNAHLQCHLLHRTIWNAAVIHAIILIRIAGFFPWWNFAKSCANFIKHFDPWYR